MDENEIRDQIEKSIKKYEDQVNAINEKIWSNPELSGQETIAHNTICDFFETLGSDYKVQRKAWGIETSFMIEACRVVNNLASARIIVFNAEYDALPNMVPVENTSPVKFKAAHACGHNLIASAAIAAFIACWETLKANNGTGTVRLLGTPAEERGGGKLQLLEKGAYKGVNACLMVHPGPMYSDESIAAVSVTRSLASQRLIVNFNGQASHAGIAPWLGKNALDALVTSYVSISALRQQLEPSCRVSGIVVHGGKAPNIIPDHTRAEYSIRAASAPVLKDLEGRVINCFKSGAQGTGCEVEVNNTRKAYWDLHSNPELCARFTYHMKGFGVNIVNELPEITDNPGASTDQGNVSYACPAIQPAFAIQSNKAMNHTPGFADAAHTPDAFKRAMACSKGMAAVGYDVLTNKAIAEKVEATFNEGVNKKAADIARHYEVKPPTEELINQLAAVVTEKISIRREQALGTLMASDDYLDRFKEFL
ncbi:hypothetical protein BGX38DRAFT_1170951 [Terfezia claveryi]|nr:hypothetical protein BGX38DRAFT_1170951 [Terfezia claveryi]